MVHREYPGSRKPDSERSVDEIRQDIAKGEENISHTVERIGERIKEKLDWREYVENSPYLVMGVAAGLGYLASAIFAPRYTPMERIVNTVADEIRNTCSTVMDDSTKSNLIKASLLGVVSKAASDWVKNALSSDGGDPYRQSQHDPRQLSRENAPVIDRWDSKQETETQIII